MKEQRQSFIFYKSFYEALEELNDKQYAKVFRAITKFALFGEEPDLTGIEKVIFSLVKPQLIANQKRYENGCKGGRKPTEEQTSENQNETEIKPKHNQIETNLEPNENVNVNDNVNVKDLKESKKESKDNNKKTNCAHVRESYEEIMDDLGTSDIVKRKIYSFVQHCQLNGKILTNDKLEGLLLQFDYKGLNDEERVEKIDNAIRGGYFDVRC